MIKPEDLRIGDLVRVSNKCSIPKGTVCVVTEIYPELTSGDKKGIVRLSYTDDTDDGPWAFGAAMSKASLLLPKFSKITVLKKKLLANIIQSLLMTRRIPLRDIWQ